MPLLDAPADLIPVQALVAEALVRVEARFNEALRSDLPPVERLCRHIEAYRGKMLRPAVVVLSGLAAHPRAAEAASSGSELITSPHITVAAVCEMIHMATLVHDDVLDAAETRRKGLTVNRLHGNEAAVILGDYLFSAAFRLCSTLDSQKSALLIGETGMTLCAGELLQLHNRENFSLDEPTYFEIIKRKTASLIAVACRLGAMHSAPGATDLHDRFAELGMSLGVAFQIQDDLLDLTGNESVVGKPLRRDIELGKLTLPLIHHLATASPVRRGRTLALLEGHPDAGRPERAAALLAAMHETDSIRHAQAAAEAFVERAKTAISPVPDGPAKRFLLLMADAVVTRAY